MPPSSHVDDPPKRPPTPPALADRLGVDPGDRDAVARALAQTQQTAVDRLIATRQARSDAETSPLATLAAPHTLADLLAAALAAAREGGDADHAEALRLHYLEALPGARISQLLGVAEPGHSLFHTPWPWARLPRFRRGLAALFALLARHDLDAARALGAADADAYLARSPTLAAWFATTYYGRLQPMFQALPHDLAAALPDPRAPASFWAAVDHRLTLPMLHELAHFGADRDALFPPYLDEALAGHLGVMCDEATAFPAPGDDHALVGFAWFSQVGEALIRAFGAGPVLAAHAGLAPWRDALPEALLSAFGRLGWAAYRAAPKVHFHPDTTRPDRWVRLIYAAAAGRDVSGWTPADLDALDPVDWALPAAPAADRAIVRHALLATTLEATRTGASFRVRRAPPAGPVLVDLDRGWVQAPPRPGAFEPAPARYALPPFGGRGRLTLTLDDVGEPAIDAATSQVLAASSR